MTYVYIVMLSEMEGQAVHSVHLTEATARRSVEAFLEHEKSVTTEAYAVNQEGHPRPCEERWCHYCKQFSVESLPVRQRYDFENHDEIASWEFESSDSMYTHILIEKHELQP